MYSFLRGSTPQFTHTLPSDFDCSTATAIDISFVQEGRIIVSRSKNEVQIISNTITYKLSQLETLSFEPDVLIYCQIKFKVGNDIIPTDIIKLSVGDILNEEEM